MQSGVHLWVTTWRRLREGACACNMHVLGPPPLVPYYRRSALIPTHTQLSAASQSQGSAPNQTSPTLRTDQTVLDDTDRLVSVKGRNNLTWT